MKRHALISEIVNNTTILDDFLRYVKVDTQADPESETFPSSMKEKDLGEILVKELKELGLKNVEMDENGYVYAHMDENNGSDKKVGFIAHMDVATDCPGEGVKPIVHENYQGGDIALPAGITITEEDSHQLKECIGDTIVTSDGSTLLGADDKAGIAAIMAMLQYIKKNPEIKHPNLRICFTPDEEIGKGVDKINLDKVDADFAYTVDGGFPCEVNYENFTAYGCKVAIKGVNIHPGYAKDKMVNALRYAAKFIDMLPKDLSPEKTEKREDFIHPVDIKGGADCTTIQMILRSFCAEDIDKHRKIINDIAEAIRKEEPKLEIDVEIKESYLNMYEVMKDNMTVVDYVKEALGRLDAEVAIEPIRGGTDGARLSFMGLPCPNLFAGGVNFHSQKEWVSVENMAMASALLVEIAKGIK